MKLKNEKWVWQEIEYIIENIFIKNIFPKWLREREKLPSFSSFERFCIFYNSKNEIPKAYHKIIISTFGSFRNLNHYFFWRYFQ